MLTLTIPTFGGHPDNLRRTINSVPMADEVVIVSTAIFDEDVEMFRSLTPKVEVLPWNMVFMYGYGPLYNQGTRQAKNKWQLLLGVAETIAEEYGEPILKRLETNSGNIIFRVDHRNDTHKWKRFWCHNSGPCWAGLIHEEIGGGAEGPVIARMQDTPKAPMDDPFKNEVLKWLKTCSYNHLYDRLDKHPHEIGNTDRGWLQFVRGARESISAFCATNNDLISAALEGDRQKFLDGVKRRMDEEKPAVGVNFSPQGTPRTGNETIEA